MNRSRNTLFVGLALIILGILFFAGQLLGIDAWKIFWPIVLIMLGLFFILGTTGYARRHSSVMPYSAPAAASGMEPTTGAGQPVAQLSEFSSVLLKGIGHVNITQGEPAEVKVEASDEVKSRLRMEVKDDTLVIRFDTDWTDWASFPWFNNTPIRFFLTMKSIKSLNLAGAGDIIANSIESDDLELIQSGAGSLKIGAIKAQDLVVKLSGAGSIDVEGQVSSQTINLSGAGSYHAAGLESQIAQVKFSGVGSAKIWVKETLNAELSGVGSVEYYGSPAVTKRLSGVGSLKDLGSK